jgi:hypothetical protein
VKAFAETDPYILKQPTINDAVQSGTILPVQCRNQGTSLMGAMKLLKQVSANEFAALIYHEPYKGAVLAGSVLERKVIKQKRGNNSEHVEFSATIGTVAGVQ